LKGNRLLENDGSKGCNSLAKCAIYFAMCVCVFVGDSKADEEGHYRRHNQAVVMEEKEAKICQTSETKDH
jgi:hypothetical protein